MVSLNIMQFCNLKFRSQCFEKLLRPISTYHCCTAKLHLCSISPDKNGILIDTLKYHKQSSAFRTNSLEFSKLVFSDLKVLKRNIYTRQQEKSKEDEESSYSTTFIYLCSAMVFMFGMAYASVPLYKIFCQKVGLGGDPKIGHKIDSLQTMKPVRARKIKVRFNANANASMLWNFKPSQDQIMVVPGETALAFFTAKNPTDEPIVGVATYNVVPYKAGLYFNKIQCFCFEEQWLNPGEEVDMPVFFYIDPDFDDDSDLAGVSEIALSYTFFKAKEGFVPPLPGFMNQMNDSAQSASS